VRLAASEIAAANQSQRDDGLPGSASGVRRGTVRRDHAGVGIARRCFADRNRIADDDGTAGDVDEVVLALVGGFMAGKTSFSNHGLRRSQMLFLGLGWGRGITSGHRARHARTVSVSDAPS
jgi:hypothetical protein